MVRPEGPITRSEADDLKADILETVRETLGRVVLDTSGIPFVDSMGLEALVDVAEQLGRGGKMLKICGTTETVKEIFELTGLLPRFEHFEDANSAVRSFL